MNHLELTELASLFYRMANIFEGSTSDLTDAEFQELEDRVSKIEEFLDDLPVWIKQEKTMQYRVNYECVINGKLRSLSLVAEAKNPDEATKQAHVTLAAEHGDGNYRIKTVKPW